MRVEFMFKTPTKKGNRGGQSPIYEGCPSFPEDNWPESVSSTI